jgi:prepilin-type N-terminal cleavage/methylation domain-containing protein
MQAEQFQTKYLEFKINKKQKRAKGFTLVEIAIVLVIVGLLVAGILKGQELITSARVRNIIDQKEAVQAAYFAFLDRYKVAPGDLSSSQGGSTGTLLPNGTAANSGTSDGIIQAVDSPAAFQNLVTAGFATNQAPANPFGGLLSLYHADGATSGSNFLATGTVTSQLILNTGAAISSSMLGEIDRKADDGIPNTGGFRYSSVTNPAGTVTAHTGTLTNCAASTGTAWQVTTVAANCAGAWLF